MLSFIAFICMWAVAFLFGGGALFASGHPLIGLCVAIIGSGWFGIIFPALVRFAGPEKDRDSDF